MLNSAKPEILNAHKYKKYQEIQCRKKTSCSADLSMKIFITSRHGRTTRTSNNKERQKKYRGLKSYTGFKPSNSASACKHLPPKTTTQKEISSQSD